MEVTWAMVADAANVTENGKVNLLGTFQYLLAPEAPVTHSSMSLAIQLMSVPEDIGKTVALSVHVYDPDMKPLFEVSAKSVFNPQENSPSVRMPHSLIMNLQNFLFPAFGPYIIRIIPENGKAYDLSIEVVPVPQPLPIGGLW